MNRQKDMKREAGILLPIASLPSKYGIGCFSKEAYEFVDKLKASGQKYWQILPLGPTGYGDSPYQSFSTFAGNPYFIDPDDLVKRGYITEEDCKTFDFGADEQCIDYGKMYQARFALLKKAFMNSKIEEDNRFRNFVKESAYWLEDYAMFMAIKDANKSQCFIKWDEDIRFRDKVAMAKYAEELKDEIQFYRFQQYIFTDEWRRLKKYANTNGIKIIGDIPIYVAFDSADAWSNPELFQFDTDGTPLAVAGCPPDAFAATGQLWGNPLYKWDYHASTSYEWWIQRLRYTFELYDVVRIDHFRGFDEYYSIPYGDETAENGHWEPGPGYAFFETVKKCLGDKQVIAEDLGYLTPSVINLVKKTGYPGMKILQFAFDSREESNYLPYNYTANCVVYTGTHDNDTTRHWYDVISSADRKLCCEYLGIHGDARETVADYMIRAALSSVAKMCIIPIQDYLNLGGEARINYPSTLGRNWTWRLSKEMFDDINTEYIATLTRIFGR